MTGCCKITEKKKSMKLFQVKVGTKDLLMFTEITR